MVHASRGRLAPASERAAQRGRHRRRPGGARCSATTLGWARAGRATTADPRAHREGHPRLRRLRAGRRSRAASCCPTRRATRALPHRDGKAHFTVNPPSARCPPGGCCCRPCAATTSSTPPSTASTIATAASRAGGGWSSSTPTTSATAACSTATRSTWSASGRRRAARRGLPPRRVPHPRGLCRGLLPRD